MGEFSGKSVSKNSLRTFQSGMSFEIFAYTGETPRGYYTSLGKTPGTIKIPDGCSLVASPLDLDQKSVAKYAHELRLFNIQSLYLYKFLETNTLKAFYENNKNIRHIIFDACGSFLGPLEELNELEYLEFRNTLAAPRLDLKKLHSLRGIIITASNNIFSYGIPNSEKLEELILFNIPCLVRIDELIEDAYDYYPTIKVLHLNNCGGSKSGRDVDVSSLHKLKNLIDFQAAGTRIVDSSGYFQNYCNERKEITDFIDNLEADSTEIRLDWKFIHNEDLKKLLQKASGINSLSLVGSRDIRELSLLSDFVSLESLSLINCDNIHSLEQLSIIENLNVLRIKNCKGIKDYRCLAKCSNLETVEIIRHPNSFISYNDYCEQLADLFMSYRRTTLVCDVPDHELEIVLEEIPKFLEEVQQELLCNRHCPCEDRRCMHV